MATKRTILPFASHIEAIRQAADHACVSHTEIAEGTGLSDATVSRTMRGISRKPSTIRRIRRFLDNVNPQSTDPVPDLVTPEAQRLEIRTR